MPTTNTLLESEYATAQLDVAERARLQELESIVENGLQTFYEVGKALEEIREQQLYRESHKSFEAYCQDKWGIARRTADRFIGAARVMENLRPMGLKFPANERQVRPLTGLPPELQLEIWQEALKSSPNGMPTGAAVQRLVEQRFPPSGKRANWQRWCFRIGEVAIGQSATQRANSRAKQRQGSARCCCGVGIGATSSRKQAVES